MRRHNIYFTMAICLGFAGLAFIFHDMPKKLVIDPRSGPAPLAVQIVGPADFIERIPRNAGPWNGCVLHVNWGDGKPEEQAPFAEACGPLLEHVYEAAGTYRVQVSVGGFQTPDGLSNVSWRGIGVVEVK